MKKNNNVFFGKEGLTSASANHIANLAKEYTQELQTYLDNMTFIDSTLEIVGSSEQHTINTGAKTSDLDKVVEIVTNISQATSLIAWLREAIKERVNLIEDIRTMSIERFVKEIKGIEMPQSPVEEDTIDIGDFIDSLGIKERNRYLYLETQCSVLGKLIHKNGSISNARKTYYEKLNKPHKVEGSGRDTLIYRYTPSVKSDSLEDLFFKLQNMHREAQASLNSIKFEGEKAIQESEIEASAKFKNEYEKYKLVMDELNTEFHYWQINAIKEIGTLKIIIPDSLHGIYQLINSLGKNKKS